MCSFLVAVVFEIFSRYDIYICIYALAIRYLSFCNPILYLSFLGVQQRDPLFSNFASYVKKFFDERNQDESRNFINETLNINI